MRVAEYVLVGDLALYIAWTQLFAFAGERFSSDGGADTLLVRLAVDSIAVRWTAAIVGLSTLIPETFSRLACLSNTSSWLLHGTKLVQFSTSRKKRRWRGRKP